MTKTTFGKIQNKKQTFNEYESELDFDSSKVYNVKLTWEPAST